MRRVRLLGCLLVVLVGGLIRPNPAHAAQTHTVQRGETLSTIARQYGLTTAELASANNIVNYDRIYAGQTLIVPVDDDGTPEAYTPAPVTSHTVRPGETLAAIAARYGLTYPQLQAANGLGNPDWIYVGQVLSIPGSGGAESSGVDSGGADPGDDRPVADLPDPARPVDKFILVDQSEQRAYIYEDGELLWEFVVSTGEPGRATANGTFFIQNKIPNAYASTWNLQMPYWLGIYWAGPLQNGFHALPIMADGSVLWDGWLGTRVSYGCVILSNEDAETLYNWAEIGTEVEIRW